MSDIFNCSELVDNEPITVVRNSGSGYGDDGRPTAGTLATISMTAIVTRMTAVELRQFSQGELTEEVRKFLTQEELNVSTEDAQSDRIIWHGKQYKVTKVDDNSDYGFYRAYGVYEGVYDL